jgi:hypothetical protein
LESDRGVATWFEGFVGGQDVGSGAPRAAAQEVGDRLWFGRGLARNISLEAIWKQSSVISQDKTGCDLDEECGKITRVQTGSSGLLMRKDEDLALQLWGRAALARAEA